MANAIGPDVAGPVPSQQRVREVDILRGFALFGVLLVNLRFMGSPQLYWRQADVAQRWPGLLDRVMEDLIQVFVVAKFLSLFSFLFGLGFGLMMRRAEQRQASFTTFYTRRLLALAAFGLLHSLLLWYGDILTTYAVLGFLLLLFRRSSAKSLLRWAAIGLLVPAVLAAGVEALGGSRTTPGLGERTETSVLAESSIRVYRGSDFREITSQRLVDLEHAYASTAPFFTLNLAMFLLGLYAERRNLVADIAENLQVLSNVRRWGLLVGLTGNVLAVMILRGLVPAPASIGILAFSVGAPALGFFYGSSVVLLAQRRLWRRSLEPLAAVGRAALSNYLLQSVIGTTLFYGYGLGLYAAWGPAVDLPLAVAIYALQAALSSWWLRRFRFGPAEWVWRSLTYWRIQPIAAA